MAGGRGCRYSLTSFLSSTRALHIAVVQSNQELTDFLIQAMCSKTLDVYNGLRQVNCLEFHCSNTNMVTCMCGESAIFV